MAKRVNNISYKGIRHTPSLVSDADGYASECVNLSPDGNDLKPMPMPVKKEGYTVTSNARLVFVHQGIGYDNYVELGDDKQTLYIKNEEGNVLYSPSWTNKSDVLAVESMGNTLIVSTTTGTEYLVYEVDNHQYKWLGQRPPMPVIEFRMHEEDSKYIEFSARPTTPDGNAIRLYDGSGGYADRLYFQEKDSPYVKEQVQISVSKLISKITDDCKFCQPFFVRFAIKMRTGDYIMQSAPVLMQPSSELSSILSSASIFFDDGNKYIDYISANSFASVLQYKVKNSEYYDDWRDIISNVDVFISEPINNYNYNDVDGNELNNNKVYLYGGYPDRGRRYVDGEIRSENYSLTGQTFYIIKGWEEKVYRAKVTSVSLFHKVTSLDLNDLVQMGDYEDLPIEILSNLATLPTLEDDFNSHCAVSPSILQVYNSRLNMANIRQRVFEGFENAFQPQFASSSSQGNDPVVKVMQAYYRIKKNGTTYTVTNPHGNSTATLDYTTYLYYPDPDCYEAVLYIRASAPGSMVYVEKFITVPMKRHEYLNGSYWYYDMNTLEQYAIDHMTAGEPPSLSQDLWYEIPNRFMMSSVGNPWHFPIGNQFDIGRREIRALSINAENMDAPQFGQNPIYVFSADGIWTIAINADGTFNKLSYVSGDVISEMKLIGRSPTASAQQTTFFKTDRGIMAIIGSQVRDIGKVMKGRAFNTIAKLLPTYSVFDGIATSGVESYWLDLIKKTSDSVSFASFAKTSDLVYDYRNDRLLLLPYAQKTTYIYVYDVANDFWSKMLPLVIDESPASPAQEEYNSREVRDITLYTEFVCAAMVGSKAVFQDAEGGLWYVGQQIDENLDAERKFGFYVSRPLRFGTDDMKTLTRIVHDMQLANNSEKVGMALYGSVDGQDYYQITRLKGKSYKFFIIVLYTHIYPSSRYAYTAFEWEARMTDKIR